MKAERLVIVDGVRTPFCKMGTDLARLGADELGRVAVNALLTRTGLDPALIDEVIFGCVAQPPRLPTSRESSRCAPASRRTCPPPPSIATALPAAKPSPP